VYGHAIKAVIHEKFGDGIMSMIDCKIDIQKKEDPKGDRVQLTFEYVLSNTSSVSPHLYNSATVANFCLTPNGEGEDAADSIDCAITVEHEMYNILKSKKVVS
jgi:hypothetical protein